MTYWVTMLGPRWPLAYILLDAQVSRGLRNFGDGFCGAKTTSRARTLAWSRLRIERLNRNIILYRWSLDEVSILFVFILVRCIIDFERLREYWYWSLAELHDGFKEYSVAFLALQEDYEGLIKRHSWDHDSGSLGIVWKTASCTCWRESWP